MLSVYQTGKLFRAHVVEVSIGIGPKIIGNDLFCLNAIPFGGYVKFSNSCNGDEAPPDGFNYFEKLNIFKQILVMGICPTSYLIISYAILGEKLSTEYTKIFTNFFMGVISPLGHAQDTLHKATAFLMNSSIEQMIPQVILYYAALNLLPIPLVAGGDILIKALRINKASPPVLEVLNWIGFLILLTWFFAIIRYFLFWWI